MSHSIHPVLAYADIAPKALKELTRDPRCSAGPNMYDGKALFDLLLREHGFVPAGDADSICIWGPDEAEMQELTLPDGSTAYGYLKWDEREDEPNRYVLIQKDPAPGDFHLNGFSLKGGTLSVGYAPGEELSALAREDRTLAGETETASWKAGRLHPRRRFHAKERKYLLALARSAGGLGIPFEEIVFGKTVAVPADIFA